jgi:hypothetical protein
MYLGRTAKLRYLLCLPPTIYIDTLMHRLYVGPTARAKFYTWNEQYTEAANWITSSLGEGVQALVAFLLNGGDPHHTKHSFFFG